MPSARAYKTLLNASILLVVVACGQEERYKINELQKHLEKDPGTKYLPEVLLFDYIRLLPSIAPQLRPYVALFESLYGHNVSDEMVAEFAALPDDIGGECRRRDAPILSHLRVNRNYWDKLDVAGREALVLHELGHCIMDRGHDNGWVMVGGAHLTGDQCIPRSTMHSDDTVMLYYGEFRAYYLDELFDRDSETFLVSEPCE